MESSPHILQTVMIIVLLSLVATSSDFVGEQKSFAITTIRKTGRQQRDAGLRDHPFTEEEQNEIVERHNEFRKQVEPTASNMQYMSWHEELADMAQTWAEKCQWEHGQPVYDLEDYNRIGQNLWRGRNGKVVGAIGSWHAEERYYTFHSHSCESGKECGHYLQVVWFRTIHVGCGRAHCEDVNWDLIVCNYGPPGNYKGVQPYVAGDTCSKCPVPSWCYNGLCRPDCKTSKGTDPCNCDCRIECDNCGIRHNNNCSCTCQTGYMEPFCTEKCHNTDNRCGNGWYRGWCDEEHSYVLNKCSEMCGLCETLPDYSKVEPCCGGMTCSGGSILDPRTCKCDYSHLSCVAGASVQALSTTLMILLMWTTFMVWKL